MTLEESQLIGRSKLKADAYLRAKLLTKVKSLPRRHRFVEKLKMISIAPYALALSSLDYFIGKVGFAYTSVVFRKNKVTSLN